LHGGAGEDWLLWCIRIHEQLVVQWLALEGVVDSVAAPTCMDAVLPPAGPPGPVRVAWSVRPPVPPAGRRVHPAVACRAPRRCRRSTARRAA